MRDPLVAATVYILRCADGSYYVGLTRTALETRADQHHAGLVSDYTRRRRPVTLVYSQPFQQLTDAIAMERAVKGWSRAKKQALIRGDVEALRQAAKKTFLRG